MLYQDLCILKSSFQRMTQSRGKPVLLEIHLLNYNIDNRGTCSDPETHRKSIGSLTSLYRGFVWVFEQMFVMCVLYSRLGNLTL